MKLTVLIVCLPLLFSCASQPESPQQRFNNRMSEIDQKYSITDPNYAALLRSSAYQERDAAIERGRISRRDRVLKTTISKTDCTNSRPTFALERTECKTVYRYEAWIKLSCQNPRLKVRAGTLFRWKMAGEEGTAAVSNSESLSIEFEKFRTTKTVGDPPVEDESAPKSFELSADGMKVKIPSEGSTKGILVVKDSLCI